MDTLNDTNETGTQYDYLAEKLLSYGFKLIENHNGWFYTIKCLNTNELFSMSNIGEVRTFLTAIAHVFSKKYIKEKFKNEHICELNVSMNDTCMVCGRKNIFNDC